MIELLQQEHKKKLFSVEETQKKKDFSQSNKHIQKLTCCGF